MWFLNVTLKKLSSLLETEKGRSLGRSTPLFKLFVGWCLGFHPFYWAWIPRTANKAAHVAAAIANLRVRHLRWASQPPPSLVLVLSRDGLPGPPS
ncbi:hypothetical protein Pyn_09560 [Prunus yedoensis var. nudiflora]|uniref:RNase H type-1 domain-containing protein n=1 Tax=Prunus yedoensis var. nudiflora TaxID=2094558 RepID=A0A314Z123_PRUYE|nr:hypothetical protein Pyn_09560 [Prunus yedoensis var. nudiflora]